MNIEPSQLLLLLNWMSPTFPTGGFAYSHGLEWAIAEGIVKMPADVEQWISDLISQGSGWNDAVLFAQCWSREPEELNVLALALPSSYERYLETVQLGRSFASAASVFAQTEKPEGKIAYPIAAGLACCKAGLPKDHALLAFLQGFCAALVSVAVRLVPLGQTAGLEVLRNLMPVITTASTRASSASLENLGSNTLLADISAMKHELLESRIFRT